MLLGIAAACFALHGIIAAVDAAYFHLYKYRLHTRPQSVVEHFTHSLRAVTMAVAAVIFFALSSAGWLLWIGLLIIVIDLVIETWDVWIERASRADLGGLSSGEYLCHAHAILLYAASYALVLASKPDSAFSLDSPVVLDPHPGWIRALGWTVAIGAAASAIQHFWYLRPAYRRST